MKMTVKECLESKGKPIPLEHTYEFTPLVDRHQQLVSIDPVHFRGQGEMQAGLFVVKGTIEGAYTLTCSRCLSDVNFDFTQRFEERYNIEAHVTDEDTDALEEIHEVHGQFVDIQPQMEEEILMSIPFIPVCQCEDACRERAAAEGISWSSGEERLTEKDKKDKKDKIDPRLADLAKFFNQEK